MSIRKLLGVILLGAAMLGHAATYYVKPAADGGNDSADCASWDTACSTLAGAVSKAGTTGDDIYVAGGVYYPAAELALKDNLSIVGGYNPSTGQRNLKKFPTVFSGDLDGNDVKAEGVTQSHTDIAGNNLARFLRATSLGDVTLEGFTITGMDQSGGNHGSAVWHQASTITYKNIRFVGNKAAGLGTVLVYGVDNFALGVFENCHFAGNFAGSGGAINAHRVGHATVKNSVFENNQASGSGGAIRINSGASSLQVSGSIFDGNTAANGGAIMIETPSAVSGIVNSTFINNAASNTGGAIRIQNAGNEITYTTIYNNDAGNAGGGIQLDNAAADALGLMSSLILANTTANQGPNINAGAGTLQDIGYNLIGQNGVSGITSGAMTFGSTSSTPAEGESDIVVGDGYYGGNGNTVKITSTSPARDAIPNDGIPFYGAGKTSSYPFTSLKQARGALMRNDYEADTYFFDLAGSYVESEGGVEYQPGGDGSLVFSTSLTADGYMVKSELPSGYTENGTEETTINSTVHIRGDAGICNGGITTTDVRGLPRADKAPAGEPVSDCDIGAFEYNDFYRIDCLDEDGLRPENTLEDAEVSWCINDLESLTPKQLLDNLGSVGWLWLSFSLLLMFIRRENWRR